MKSSAVNKIVSALLFACLIVGIFIFVHQFLRANGQRKISAVEYAKVMAFHFSNGIIFKVKEGLESFYQKSVPLDPDDRRRGFLDFMIPKSSIYHATPPEPGKESIRDTEVYLDLPVKLESETPLLIAWSNELRLQDGTPYIIFLVLQGQKIEIQGQPKEEFLAAYAESLRKQTKPSLYIWDTIYYLSYPKHPQTTRPGPKP